MTDDEVPNEFIESIKQHMARIGLHLHKEVLEAFKEVSREQFVGKHTQRQAYIDRPLPIPKNQTISAPHMYAMMMSEGLGKPRKGMRILEIGTGSGYGAALLANVVETRDVISVERHQELVKFARDNLEKSKIDNVKIIHGDGTSPNVEGKFDRILITAAGPKVPQPLIDLLEEDGRMIIPLDEGGTQWLCLVTKDGDDVDIAKKYQVRFVPLIGKEGH